MCEFIKLPNGIIRKDLILHVTKYEKEYRPCETLYSVIVETECKQFEYDENGRNLYSEDDSNEKAKQRRDQIYEDIVKQLLKENKQ